MFSASSFEKSRGFASQKHPVRTYTFHWLLGSDAVRMSRSICLLVLVLAYSAARGQSSQEIEAPEAQVNTEWFKACVTDWDSATHMTKNEWANTCRRLSAEPAERGEFSKDTDFEPIDRPTRKGTRSYFPDPS